MRATALAFLLVPLLVAPGLLPTLAFAQAAARWSYPRGERSDPVLPPAALYTGEASARLHLDAVMYDAQTPAASRALVRLGEDPATRRVVRAGDVVGSYRIHRVERGRIVVELRALGAARQVVLPVGGHARAGSPSRP